jgi:DNA modification methylase
MAINASPEIRNVPLKTLKPAPYNPRRIDASAMAGLEKSLERFGVVEPIIFNERSGFVVGGHQRLKVLRRQKVKSTDVVIVDLDEIDEKALNVALNNPAIGGVFSDKLADLLAEIQGSRAELFADVRLDQLLAEADAKRRTLFANANLDDAPEPPKNPVTQAGDVWTLGRHRLVCGDSTDTKAIVALLGDDKVDLLLTDPPYGVDYGNAQAQTFKSIGTHHRPIENDTSIDYRRWFASWLKEVPWGHYASFYIFMSDRELHSLREAIDDCAFVFGSYLVWNKDRLVMGRKDYKAKHEAILYGWPDRHRFYGPPTSTTVIDVQRPHKADLHPTMKPVALLEQLLSDGSPNGALVLDLFGGSGSTLIACEASDRRCRMVELDPAYCDVIVQRWETLTGQKAVRNDRP